MNYTNLQDETVSLYEYVKLYPGWAEARIKKLEVRHSHQEALLVEAGEFIEKSSRGTDWPRGLWIWWLDRIQAQADRRKREARIQALLKVVSDAQSEIEKLRDE